MENRLLFENNQWDFGMLDRAMTVLSGLAQELRLDTYPNQIEIISSEQMLDAYASSGLPIMYKHWSFGKAFSKESDLYRRGKRGLAYEIVLNTSPSISYLMEENSACTQVLVLAHAAFGHNHFFKNNYLFKTWTDASTVLDYLIFAKNYIVKCEEKYGIRAVEQTLDSAHALQHHGIDRYKHPRKLNLREEQNKQKEREEYLQTQVNALWNRTIKKPMDSKDQEPKVFPKQPEENILYFLEKHSPILESWQREILRIVRKIAQYFYPQMQTKVMNEGWASFTHYYLMNRLWDEGYINDGAMLEFIALHTNVLYQPNFDDQWYSGLNPYYLGFEIFSDIRRICENPDSEDRELFPNIVDRPWVDTVLDAVNNYRDESFIRQFLGPKVIRKLRLFNISDHNNNDQYVVQQIHDLESLRGLRNALANKYEVDEYHPKLEITQADLKNDRSLTVMYQSKQDRRLADSANAVMQHLARLWGHPVRIVDDNGNLLFSHS